MENNKKTKDREKLREQWRVWAQAKRDRMSPEQLAEYRGKAKARKIALRSTPEGAEKHREQCRRWRENNPDKLAKMRENEKIRKREKAAALKKARESDPAYLETKIRKHQDAKEKAKKACERYRAKRKERLATDAEFAEQFNNKQKKYRENAKARLMQSPEWKEKQAARAIKQKERTQKVELTEKEREEHARRRREEKVKAQRLLRAKERAERENKELSRNLPRPKFEEQKNRPKMGRFTALSRWYGR